jgi:hypothetical protein
LLLHPFYELSSSATAIAAHIYSTNEAGYAMSFDLFPSGKTFLVCNFALFIRLLAHAFASKSRDQVT